MQRAPRPQPNFIAWLCCALALTFALPAAADQGKQKHLTVGRITPPPMVAPTAKLLRKGQVQLGVKLVYAHNRQRKYTTQSLLQHLPKLSHITGFNAYQLMRRIHRKVAYNKSILIRISHRFQVRLNPKGYSAKGRDITLQVTFFYRKRKGKQRGQFAAYATTLLKVPKRHPVVFVGPAHRKGRAILILSATQK